MDAGSFRLPVYIPPINMPAEPPVIELWQPQFIQDPNNINDPNQFQPWVSRSVFNIGVNFNIMHGVLTSLVNNTNTIVEELRFLRTDVNRLATASEVSEWNNLARLRNSKLMTEAENTPLARLKSPTDGQLIDPFPESRLTMAYWEDSDVGKGMADSVLEKLGAKPSSFPTLGAKRNEIQRLIGLDYMRF